MNNRKKGIQPYEGGEPYLYFAFADADRTKAGRIIRRLMERGCRVWYCCGPAGGADELLHRQERCCGAALTAVYLSDAACADRETKSSILVNQKFGRQVLCLDPDGTDRRLSMGLYENVPHVPLYRCRGEREQADEILHAEGFSQQMMGPPMKLGGGLAGRAAALLCIMAVLLAVSSFVFLHYLRNAVSPPADEVLFTEPVLMSAVREAAGGGAITEAAVNGITELRLERLPESWEELTLLPSLERIVVPQQTLLEDGALPDGGYVIVLEGG